jgi:hypothetical protein
LKTYECETCGARAQSPRSNAKYCVICRTFRNLKYVGAKTSKCWACKSSFAPLHRNDVLCGSCDDDATRGPTAQCRLCQDMRSLYHDDILICGQCMKKPAAREPVMHALFNKQVRRRRDHAVPA